MTSDVGGFGGTGARQHDLFQFSRFVEHLPVLDSIMLQESDLFQFRDLLISRIETSADERSNRFSRARLVPVSRFAEHLRTPDSIVFQEHFFSACSRFDHFMNTEISRCSSGRISAVHCNHWQYFQDAVSHLTFIVSDLFVHRLCCLGRDLWTPMFVQYDGHIQL